MTDPLAYLPTSPMSIVCPKCGVAPWIVCQVPLTSGDELVHWERIKAAAAIDVATAKKRGQ